jgi:hypothetical protein
MFVTNDQHKNYKPETEEDKQIALENERKKIDDEERVRKRQEQALMFEKYLEESGLSLSF